MSLIDRILDGRIHKGSVTIARPDGSNRSFGKPAAGWPDVVIRINERGAERRILTNPRLGLGETFMDGAVSVDDDDIMGLVELVRRNNVWEKGGEIGDPKPLKRAFKKIMRPFNQMNSLARSRSNVAHHYDLSNDFYRQWLDEDMQYSCGYHATPETTLAEAQRAKKAHVAAKLNLQPGNTVLDIGCGWGGLALYIAENFDVHVTGVTLSKEQHALATARIAERGLEGKVEFVLSDYRDLTGPYDRIVSYGMFEQVGVPHFLEFFTKVSDLMADDGCMLLHSIGRKGGPGSTARWIRKYIFPGGYSPALSETLAEIEKSGLWVTDIEILRIHYAETLRYWDDNFQANRAKVAAMFDERFCRMWEFYLIVSEYSFRYSKNMNFQIQLSKSVNALPITRDYMIEAERKLNSA